MTGALPARVRVSVLPSGDFTRIRFSASRKATPDLTLTLDGKDRVERALAELDTGLVRVRDALPGLRPGDADLAAAYAALEDLGDALLYTLFGNDEQAIHGLQDFWRSALPFARNPRLPPLLVECVAGTPLPIEYLPLLGQPGHPPESRADLLDRFRSFIGFSCLAHRRILAPQPAAPLDLAVSGDGTMPVRFLQYDALDGARQELAWFGASGLPLRLEGPYPDDRCGVSLPQQIFDPRLLLSGARRELPDQIQHFACHCYTRARTPLDSEIELSGPGQTIRLRLGDIGRELVRLSRRSELRDFDLPLVVLNACGSARLQASSAFSFPQLFLKNRNRGFIGTEIEMPDDVASAFSGAFYERFLRWGMPLGRSMLEARRHLLYELGNPLGIAYTAYADAELRARPDQGEN